MRDILLITKFKEKMFEEWSSNLNIPQNQPEGLLNHG